MRVDDVASKMSGRPYRVADNGQAERRIRRQLPHRVQPRKSRDHQHAPGAGVARKVGALDDQVGGS